MSLKFVKSYWSRYKVGSHSLKTRKKVAKIQGEFIWHTHHETDEAFIVLNGEIKIEFRDGIVTIKKGEMFVVPAGVEHKPSSLNESQIMLIEPKGVVNTGENKTSNLIAENDVWI